MRLVEVAAHPQRPRYVVGFAAETCNVDSYARDKLVRKQLDMIAANDVSCAGQGFESEDNALTVLTRDARFDIARASKSQVAQSLLKLVAEQLGATA